MTTLPTHKKVVFIFNGPPNTGKDFAADVVVSHFQGAVKLEFKRALRKVAHHMASLFYGQGAYALDSAQSNCNIIEYSKDKAAKDTITSLSFGNRTWRQFLIWISEEVMKPIFGQNIFGQAAAKLVLESQADIIAFSDGGFQVEVNELSKLESVAVYVIQLRRAGHTWGNDSRGYVTSDDKINTWAIINSGDAGFKEEIVNLVSHIVAKELGNATTT